MSYTPSRSEIYRLIKALGPSHFANDVRVIDKKVIETMWNQERDRFAHWKSFLTLDDLIRRYRSDLIALNRLNATIVYRKTEFYPQAFFDLVSPPPVLFIVGSPLRYHKPSIAIIGSRAAFKKDTDFTHDLAFSLSKKDYLVVSGGALGIDGAAHQGALHAKGQTIAIIGSGLAHLYPARHRPLFAEIIKQGQLLTPFAFHEKPIGWHFIKRNHLIAALADITVVISASRRSGSLSTARHALKLGRKVFAKKGSPGCEEIIREGAIGFSDRDQFHSLLQNNPDAYQSVEPLLKNDHLSLIDLLSTPHSAESAAIALKWTIDRTLLNLLELELKGLIRKGTSNCYEKAID